MQPLRLGGDVRPLIAADDPAAVLQCADGFFDAVDRLADFLERGRLAAERADRGVRSSSAVRQTRNAQAVSGGAPEDLPHR